MPCMNSTSAGDRGGRLARVDDGSVLLGAPGAPGCTTTGFAGSVCACATGERETAKALAANNARIATPGPEPGLGLRRKRTCLQLGVRGKIFIWTRTKSFHETGNFHRGKDERELTPERYGKRIAPGNPGFRGSRAFGCGSATSALPRVSLGEYSDSAGRSYSDRNAS